jgi:hypothetical protein
MIAEACQRVKGVANAPSVPEPAKSLPSVGLPVLKHFLGKSLTVFWSVPTVKWMAHTAYQVHVLSRFSPNPLLDLGVAKESLIGLLGVV